MALEFRESGNRPDDVVLRRQTEVRSKLITIVSAMKECIDIHAGVDRGEEFMRSYSCCKSLFAHGICNADDLVAASRCPAFAPDIKLVNRS